MQKSAADAFNDHQPLVHRQRNLGRRRPPPGRFANWDLSPAAISNHEMGLAFEELIRKFAESSNETAGEHFTPRDIVRLTTALVFMEDDAVLTRAGIVRSIYDPTVGTGGFLSSGMEYLYELNQHARLAPFGQELNPESYATCKADMLIKGQDVSNIKLGNTLSDDQLPTDKFYNTGIATYIWLLCNHKSPERRGQVQHIQATDTFEKMRKSLGSKRRLFSDTQIDAITASFGKAEAHEADEHGIVSKMFPTTNFGYRRITVERPLQLRFDPQDADKRAALLADAAWEKLTTDEPTLATAILSVLGQLKPSYLSRNEFTKNMAAALAAKDLKLKTTHLKLIAQRCAESDEAAELCRDSKGNLEADPSLRDYENVPLGEDIDAYFAREVTPHVPEAWIDEFKRDDKDGEIGVVGYEIPFNRHFYTYTPPRALAEIDAELAAVTGEIQALLKEISA